MPKITYEQFQQLPELHQLVCEQLIRKGLWELTLGANNMKKDGGDISRR